jgi:hypothetical protein
MHIKIMMIMTTVDLMRRTVCIQDMVDQLFWHFMYIVNFAMSIHSKCSVNWSLKTNFMEQCPP